MIRLLIGFGLVLFLITIYRCKDTADDITTVGGGGEVDTTSVPTIKGEYMRLEKEFEITELGRTRKVWIYLPPNYDDGTTWYPVMYMQDGQNLFDQAASFSGEWEIDESMDLFYENNVKTTIVVGIENDGENRLQEYSPWVNTFYNQGGEGDAYVDFIVNEVKPYIDANYRTRSDASNTCIGGSSMGGLISMYAAVKYQNVFGKALIFSPSFWFTDEIFTYVEETGPKGDLQVYLAAGRNEDGQIAAKTDQMRIVLKRAGFASVEMRIDDDGFHGEGYWARAFQPAYRWLFVD